MALCSSVDSLEYVLIVFMLGRLSVSQVLALSGTSDSVRYTHSGVTQWHRKYGIFSLSRCLSVSLLASAIEFLRSSYNEFEVYFRGATITKTIGNSLLLMSISALVNNCLRSVFHVFVLDCISDRLKC